MEHLQLSPEKERLSPNTAQGNPDDGQTSNIIAAAQDKIQVQDEPQPADCQQPSSSNLWHPTAQLPNTEAEEANSSNVSPIIPQDPPISLAATGDDVRVKEEPQANDSEQRSSWGLPQPTTLDSETDIQRAPPRKIGLEVRLNATPAEGLAQIDMLTEMNHHDQPTSRERVEGLDSKHSSDILSDGNDPDDGDYDPRNGKDDKPKSRQQPKSKVSAKSFRPKSAREYMAHLNKQEDDAEERTKRKAESDDVFHRKKRMTAHGGQVSIMSLVKEAAEHLAETNHAPASPAPLIQATTKKQMFSGINRTIPAGADTRRTSTQKHDLEEATRLFGFRKIRAKDGAWLLRGMVNPLLSHQLTAAAWMVKRELGRFPPFGGLYADYMGMGKTITSLACVIGNPPETEDVDQFSCTTLVVVPNLSVAHNWRQETRKHCKPEFSSKVLVYDSRNDEPLGVSGQVLLLITTYRTLLKDFPSDTDLSQLTQDHQHDTAAYNQALVAKSGFLLRQKWYRVILDEAHEIKNLDSRTKRACCQLQSKHNWALSGTPLANTALGMSSP
ncbi:hypothetical protein XA68_10942 [Ophiocordyceps unilateralis]|uniref:Helicase ATP-binding domain-containing protein n=1 Tax=Ophiocordyceps unilateralis TaxID=268505 RepID=A0A2A9PGF9_OPHUN|nr:hypothetical protein XA68_10942 [Ophiocordyceps unilateralis]